MSNENDSQQLASVLPFEPGGGIEAQARRWLIRLDSERPLSSAEKASLREWLQSSADNKKHLLRLAEFWHGADVLSALSDTEEQTSRPSRPARARRNWAFTLAASVVLGLTVTLSLWNGTSTAPAVELTQLTTATGEVRRVTLSDGSEVLLNTNSALSTEFSDSLRKITLTHGEAYFSVKRDPDREFRVYAKDGIVSAVGTAFSVRIDRDELKVVVESGRVDLASKLTAVKSSEDAQTQHPNTRTPEPVQLVKLGSLGQGQSARFLAQGLTSSLLQTLRDGELAIINEVPLDSLTREMAWRRGYLSFSGQSFREVISEVERYIPERIIISDPSIYEVQIGGRFRLNQLDDFFVALEKGFGIKISRPSKDEILLEKVINA